MKIIKSTNGDEIIVDDEDWDSLVRHTWTTGEELMRGKYAIRNVPHPTKPGKQYTLRMHRMITGLMIGDKRKVDHINGNTLDNRRSNLRICSNSENSRNCRRPRRNTSGFKGVSLFKATGRWAAYIRVDFKKRHLGFFDTPEAAHEAYRLAAIELHGEFANFGEGSEIEKQASETT